MSSLSYHSPYSTRPMRAIPVQADEPDTRAACWVIVPLLAFSLFVAVLFVYSLASLL